MLKKVLATLFFAFFVSTSGFGMQKLPISDQKDHPDESAKIGQKVALSLDERIDDKVLNADIFSVCGHSF